MNGFQIGSKRLKVQHKRIAQDGFHSQSSFPSAQPQNHVGNGPILSMKELEYPQPYVNYQASSGPAEFSGFHQMGYDRY